MLEGLKIIRPLSRVSNLDTSVVHQAAVVMTLQSNNSATSRKSSLLNSPPLLDNRDFGLPKVATYCFMNVATMTSLCLEDTIDSALNLSKALIKLRMVYLRLLTVTNFKSMARKSLKSMVRGIDTTGRALVFLYLSQVSHY